MEFRHPYMVAMQDQNPKLYRRLRDSGELDRLVEMKAREANQLYQKILADQPKTLQAEREAAEHVRAMMFEFPDDMMTATQEVQPEAGSHSNVFHMLARTAEQSQSKITGLPLLPGLIDEPGMFDPSEKW